MTERLRTLSEAEQLVRRARDTGRLALLAKRTREIIETKYSEEDGTPPLSNRELAEIFGMGATTMGERVREAMDDLRAFSSPRQPVDSHSAC